MRVMLLLYLDAVACCSSDHTVVVNLHSLPSLQKGNLCEAYPSMASQELSQQEHTCITQAVASGH